MNGICIHRHAKKGVVTYIPATNNKTQKTIVVDRRAIAAWKFSAVLSLAGEASTIAIGLILQRAESWRKLDY